MGTFGLNVIASDKDFYHGRGTSIALPAKDGSITILAHHADMRTEQNMWLLWEAVLPRLSITV